MSPKFFATQKQFRTWLEKNHESATELVVGFYKVNSGKPSITWPQSVDEVLCFGWIDGVRTSIDERSYQIRFTPRKPSSIWSAVNIRKIKELTEKGLMKPAGLASFKHRKEERSKIYAHETEEATLSPEFQKPFKANKKAWAYFQSLAPSYQKLSKSWVMSARQAGTRQKRLETLIGESVAGTNRWKDNKYIKK